ncbi:Ig-like domain-containing protein [Bacillus sp. EB01]|uniref:Ig-like domain-containing protein n=1 Tax=Bacillus sp. EB01 TaxID=1347086 RepID=UPI0005C491A6|nr:Ig-like domain-containing protein [Bacillus sp. EB01]
MKKKLFFLIAAIILFISTIPVNNTLASDLKEPVLKVLNVNKKEVTVGDSIELSIGLEDVTDVNYIVAWYISPITKSTTYVTLYYNVETGLFEGIIPIQSTSEIGEYQLNRITFYLDGYTTNIFESTFFTDGNFNVNGTNTEDFIKSISVDKKEAVSGNSVKISVKVSDAKGINYINALYVMPISNNSIYVKLNYNSESGFFEGSIPIQSISEPGEYTFTRLDVYKSDNIISFDQSEYLKDGNFTITGTSGMGFYSSLSIDKKEVTAGETVNLKMKVNDNEGIRYILLWYSEPLTNKTKYFYLYFNNQTGFFEGSLKINSEFELGQYSTNRFDLYASGLTYSYIFSDHKLENGDFIVVKDVVPPSVPVVINISDHSTSISGTSEPGSTVKVLDGENILASAETDQNGDFIVYIPIQRAGTALMITATDTSGNESQGVTILVEDKTPPPNPIVSDIGDSDTVIIGETDPYDNVVAYANGKIIGEAFAEGDGKFSIQISPQHKETLVTVFSIDNSGNQNDGTTVLVKDKTRPIVHVNAVTDQDTFIVGTTEAEALVTAMIENETLSTIADDEGKFRIQISRQMAERKITLTATDGINDSEPVVITVIDVTAPIIYGVTDNGIYNRDLVIHFNEGAGTLNGENFISGTVVNMDGIYTLVVTDKASNKTTVEFSIDLQAPVVSGVQNDVSYNKDVIPTFEEGTATLNGAPFKSGEIVKVEGDYDLVVTDTAGNNTTIKFTIDKTAPIISGVENNRVYTSEVVPAFNEGTATLNGSSFSRGEVISSEGAYTLVVTDKAGNSTTAKFGIDKTAPVVSGVKDNTSYNKDVTATFNEGTATLNKVHYSSGDVVEAEGDYTLVVTDQAGNKTTVKFTIDKTAPVIFGVKADSIYNQDVTPTSNEGTATLNGSVITSGTTVKADGSYTLVVTDKAGNKTTIEFSVDKTFPVVTGVENNGYYNKEVTPVFNEGTATLNGAAFTSGTKVTAAGIYTLVVTDKAGNATTVKFTIDKTAPKITGVTNNAYYNKDVKITFEEGRATLNGVAFKSGSVVKNPGVYTLVVTDLAGNKTTVKFTIDKTAPKVTGVTNNAFYNKDVKVSFNEGKATLNGVAFTSGTVVKTAKVYTLVVTDAAGNKTTVKFTIDKTAPKVTGVANNAFYNKEVRIYFNEGKATLNGVAFKSGTVVKTAKAYTLVVTDSAGNKITVKFTIDKTPPAVPKVNTVKSGSKTVTGTAEAYSVVTIKVGTKVIGKATTDRYGKYKVTIPAQKRNTALYVTAKDRAGNVGKATRTVVK